MKVNTFVCFATIVCAFVVTVCQSRAAYTDDLDGLRAELVSRSLLLSNSIDKTEIKQKKACDQCVGFIDKPGKSLATDIKTAKKVATKMIKAFPTEFISANAAGITFSNNIVTVLLGAYYALGTDLQEEIITLGGLIATLPDGSDKLKALTQFDSATNLLALAQTSFTFAQGSALLGKSLKAALKGQQIAIKAGAGGGGGSCGTITQSSVTMTAGADNFNATSAFPGFAGGEYTQSTMTFSVGGTDGATGNAVAFTVDSGVTGLGTYTNVSGNYTIGSPPTQTFNITSGSMTITGVDLAHNTACGTGTFSATDGVNVINVSDFAFSINTLGVSP